VLSAQIDQSLRHLGVDSRSSGLARSCPSAPYGGRTLAEIAAKRGATPSQITLAWLLRRSPAMLPIPGTLSLDHLKENLGALEIELSDAEFDALLR
jgi:diketogulonate reductase-like aldo/keto reductase